MGKRITYKKICPNKYKEHNCEGCFQVDKFKVFCNSCTKQHKHNIEVYQNETKN